MSRCTLFRGLTLTITSMLVAFNVTNLARWGYDNSTVFIDPMESAFRPKQITAEDFTDNAIRLKLAWFWSLDAYNRTVPSVGRRRMAA
jgi:bilirubin oxidase